MNKEYQTIAEFFYQKASDRVKKRVTESKLTYAEILPPDPKQISRIVNNKPVRNNPYLINNSALQTTYVGDGIGEMIPCGLIPSLNFNSEKDVLWGTDEEITNYISELFYLLWNEVCLKSTQFDSELYLCDYIPYAKYSTYWKIFFDNDTINDPRFSFAEYNGKMLNFPAMFFGIREDTVIKNIDSARNEALIFLYNKCKKTFLSEFITFANATTSFHMLNKTIKNVLVEKTFLPMLEKYRPNSSSLGLRVRNLIYDDLSYNACLVSNRQIENAEYIRHLVKASQDYILQLEEIQNRIISERK